jgi:hypothetical protein
MPQRLNLYPSRVHDVYRQSVRNSKIRVNTKMQQISVTYYFKRVFSSNKHKLHRAVSFSVAISVSDGRLLQRYVNWAQLASFSKYLMHVR